MTEHESQHRSYENYWATASSYDDTRVPVGIDIIVDVMNQRGIRPEAARLLDAGCGTGSYLVALQNRVGTLKGLERGSTLSRPCGTVRPALAQWRFDLVPGDGQ